jgi:hypothetical protein
MKRNVLIAAVAVLIVLAVLYVYGLSGVSVPSETDRSEAELLSAQFPEVVGNYERYGTSPEEVQKREECVPQGGAELCVTTVIVEYRQTDGNAVVFAHFMDVPAGEEEKLRSYLAGKATPHRLDSFTAYRLEKHEFGWYTATTYDFILTQEGVFSGNSVAYPREALGQNPVTQYFLLTYPPAAS